MNLGPLHYILFCHVHYREGNEIHRIRIPFSNTQVTNFVVLFLTTGTFPYFIVLPNALLMISSGKAHPLQRPSCCALGYAL